MKQAVLNLMLTGGAFTPFRMVNRNKAVVLTYHRFGENDPGVMTSAELFAAQLEYLRRNYNVLPLSVIANALAEGRELPPYAAAVTIDDGYRDAYEIAFPLLSEFEIPATLFVVTGFLDRQCWIWPDKLRYLALQTGEREVAVKTSGSKLFINGSDRKSRLASAGRVNETLKKMPDSQKEEVIQLFAKTSGIEFPVTAPDEFAAISWEQAIEMKNNCIEIGSHTVTHPILNRVNEAQLQMEMAESRVRIEKMLGSKADIFCYPNGDFGMRERSAVKQAGYRCAVTTRHGFNDLRSDLLTLRRINAEHDIAHFVQSTSGFEQVKNSFRRISVGSFGME